jgi:hypothetical protein
MSILLCLWLAAVPVKTPVGLTVTRVVREGLPPYEDANRLYRLEGAGFDKLQPGSILKLHRPQEPRAMPRLEVTLVMPEYVLARVAAPGETYPLLGDRVYLNGSLPALPAMPGLEDPPGFTGLKPLTPTLTAPTPEPGFTPNREPLYFLQGESRLSPAGKVKLQGWVKAWGPSHRWSVACPPWPGESLDLTAARINALKEELRRLGVPHVDEHILTEEIPGAFPVIYVQADPW